MVQTLETRRFYLTALHNEVFWCFAGARRMRARFLVLVMNHGCNLRCRDCRTLTPYLAREFARLPALVVMQLPLAQPVVGLSLPLQVAESNVFPNG